MSTADLEPTLKSLFKSLRSTYGAPEAPAAPEDPIDEFLWAFLVWETSTSKAENALKRIQSTVVDINELRVSLPGEIIAMLGERYPLVEERAVRMRAALDDIFRREHAVSLASLKSLGKREAKQYLDSIDAIPGYVSSRVTLIALGGHAAPLDQRTLDLMMAEEIFEPGTSIEDATAALTRVIKAADSMESFLLLQAWSDDADGGSKKSKRSGRSTTKKKSTRKKSSAGSTTKKKTTTRSRKKRVG